MFELKHKDLAGRIGTLETAHGKITTPTLMPVLSPNHLIIAPKQMKREFGVQTVITNSYSIFKNKELREKCLEGGIHKFLDFDGPITTDSGGFQIYKGKDIDLSPEEIHKFQQDIGVDFAIILDTPPAYRSSVKGTKAAIQESIKRAKASFKHREHKQTKWYGVVHLSPHRDSVGYSARALSKLPFDVYSLGSGVGMLINYKFSTFLDGAVTAMQILPQNKPRHMLGIGHPMFMAFAVAVGGDLFDSAMYALSAKEGRYLTISGTSQLQDLEELPCSCPICSRYRPEEFTEELLARHNLYVTFQELRTIRQAIRENTLWELLEERSRGHPALYAAFLRMKRHRKYIESLDPYTKKRFFYLSRESLNRTELYRHSHNSIPSKRYVDAFPFKKVPCEITDRYPFGQRELPENKDLPPCGSPLERANALAEYQFGGRLFPRGSKVRVSRTGRIRTVASNGKILASFRSGDLVCIPHEAARTLHKKTNSWRVVVDQETAEFPAKGLNAFAKFVTASDPKIRAGMEVLVVDEGGALLAEGQAVLSAREMLEFNNGVAVRVRKGFGT